MPKRSISIGPAPKPLTGGHRVIPVPCKGRLRNGKRCNAQTCGCPDHRGLCFLCEWFLENKRPAPRVQRPKRGGR